MMLLVRSSVSSGATDRSNSIRSSPRRSIPTAALRTIPPDFSARKLANVLSRSVSQETSGVVDGAGAELVTTGRGSSGGFRTGAEAPPGPLSAGRQPANASKIAAPVVAKRRFIARLAVFPGRVGLDRTGSAFLPRSLWPREPSGEARAVTVVQRKQVMCREFGNRSWRTIPRRAGGSPRPPGLRNRTRGEGGAGRRRQQPRIGSPPRGPMLPKV